MKFALVIIMIGHAPITLHDLSAERCHAHAAHMLENARVKSAECVAQPVSWLWLFGREGK
jgi:hypothetical protein